jgi:putative aldouronate transport system substrate-binding protein
MKLGKSLLSGGLCLVLAALPVSASGRSDGSQGAGKNAAQPVNGDTVTYWVGFNIQASANYASLGETPFGKGLMEKTGIKVEFLHPPAGSGDEQFNLLVASGDLPDIMERDWLAFPGGPEKAIGDGVIIKLNDIFDRYAPNARAYFNANPEFDKMIKTDKGNYYVFPFIRNDPGLLTTFGLCIRKDWLDELGLRVPETIDDWHTVLTAFKEKKKALAPLTFEYNSWNADLAIPLAYRAVKGWYVGDDKKAHFGTIENAYRDWLTTFSAWYKEGLVDPDLPSQQFQQVSAKMTGGISGASCGPLASRMGTWMTSARATNPNFTLVAVPAPVLKRGDKPFKGNIDNPYKGYGSAAITTSCKNVELAARLLDWGYGEEGILYYNFGTEGESYTMVNGKPIYTDFVLKNPKGWSVAQALGAYARSVDIGPFVQKIGYLEQYYSLPEQKEALKILPVPGALAYVLPPISQTPEESQEFSRIMNEINTYVNEMILKFTLGTESLSNWDNYVNNIKRMGIDRAIELRNAALTRYNAR